MMNVRATRCTSIAAVLVLIAFACAAQQADNPITREQARCNRLCNAASDALGEIRAVRCTDFGSLWIGERGYAVFAFEDRRVTIEGLEGQGWQVSIPEGKGGELAFANGKVSGYLLAGEAAVVVR